jgi:hypothetical protein
MNRIRKCMFFISVPDWQTGRDGESGEEKKKELR